MSLCGTHRDGGSASRHWLESLWPQLPPTAEIVLVDRGSRDESRAFLERFADENPDRFRLYVEPGATRGRARDLAWRRSEGRVIVHVDANRRWRDGAVQKLVDLVAEARKRPVEIVTTFRGGNRGPFLIPRVLLAEIGGYDTSLDHFEDAELARRLERMAGLKVVMLQLYSDEGRSATPSPVDAPFYYWARFRDAARVGNSLPASLRTEIVRPMAWPFLPLGVGSYFLSRLRGPGKGPRRS